MFSDLAREALLCCSSHAMVIDEAVATLSKDRGDSGNEYPSFRYVNYPVLVVRTIVSSSKGKHEVRLESVPVGPSLHTLRLPAEFNGHARLNPHLVERRAAGDEALLIEAKIAILME